MAILSFLIPAPFPGGCCLTCNMDFDPNLVISYDSVETNVTFSFANVYYKRCVLLFKAYIHIKSQTYRGGWVVVGGCHSPEVFHQAVLEMFIIIII